MDKSTRWSFTAYEAQWNLFTLMPPLIAEWGWQTEVCPTTGKRHYQGWLRTTSQVRLRQLRRVLPGVHLEIAKNWEALLTYCSKTDTAVPGTQVTEQSSYMNKFQFLEYIVKKVLSEYGYEYLTELHIDALVLLVLAEARFEVIDRPYLVWIISDPNFKLVLRENSRALLLSYSKT